MEYIEHQIIEGDRFDTLAYNYWGNCNYAPIIVIDNRHLSVHDDLPVGEICYIRETITQDENLTINDTLPFWKR